MHALAAAASSAARARPARGATAPGSKTRRGVSVVRRAKQATGTETEEPTADDFATFNALVSGGDWELVQKNVRAAAVEGKLTPGVLGAAYSVHQKCVASGEPPEVVQTLQNVIQLFTQTMQSLKATPAVRMVDELMTFDPFTQQDAVEGVIASGDVERNALAETIQMMLDGMSESDAAWEAHVASAVETKSKEEFEQLVAHANGRMEAKRRLSQLKVLCDR